MGLDFRGADAHWSYSGFNRFRERLSEKLGFNLRDMYGFSGTRSWDSLDNPKDPIHFLLNHCDCDGHLTARQCGLVAPRLKELVSDWAEDDYDKVQALRLVKGMKQCAKAKNKLEFC